MRASAAVSGLLAACTQVTRSCGSFSSSDAQAGLPSSYTFTAADAGVHTFSATLKTAGSQSITVKDPAAQAKLAKLPSGTVVEVTYTQSLAIKLEKTK